MTTAEEARAAAIADDPANGMFFRIAADGQLEDLRPAIAAREVEVTLALENLEEVSQQFIAERSGIHERWLAGELSNGEARNAIDAAYRAVRRARGDCKLMRIPSKAYKAATAGTTPIYADIVNDEVVTEGGMSVGSGNSFADLPYRLPVNMPGAARQWFGYSNEAGEEADEEDE